MGRTIRRYLIISLLFLFSVTIGLADAPPDPGGDPNTGGGTPVGGGTPLGGGFIITLVLASAYGIRKAVNFRNN